jgi:hypothetical protein
VRNQRQQYPRNALATERGTMSQHHKRMDGANKNRRQAKGGTHVLAAAHAEGLDFVDGRGARLLAASPIGRRRRSRGLRRGAEVHHHAPFIAGARHGRRRTGWTGSAVEETGALRKLLAIARLCCSWVGSSPRSFGGHASRQEGEEEGECERVT